MRYSVLAIALAGSIVRNSPSPSVIFVRHFRPPSSFPLAGRLVHARPGLRMI